MANFGNFQDPNENPFRYSGRLGYQHGISYAAPMGRGGAMFAALNQIGQAMSAWGDAMQYRQMQQMANDMMNNGLVPGAAPYVRRALATNDDGSVAGEQPADPGPTPFPSQNTPHTGGINEFEIRRMLSKDAQRAAMDNLQMEVLRRKAADAADQSSVQDILRSRALDLQERNLALKEGALGRRAAGGKAPQYTTDSLGAVVRDLKTLGISPGDLDRGEWRPGPDDDSTSLVFPDGNTKLNPAYKAPTKGLFGSSIGASPGSGPDVPQRTQTFKTVTVPTEILKPLYDRYQALSDGTPFVKPKGGSWMHPDDYQQKFLKTSSLPPTAGDDLTREVGGNPVDEPVLPPGLDANVMAMVNGSSAPTADSARTTAPLPTSDDQKALSFLQQNPNDPRAPAITAKLRAKGLIK